ncbi:MAG TPA: hypothetical protein VE996_11400 [Terriglobales bacterium]|nr:hypothetical protein [Terriglobales bacterium]
MKFSRSLLASVLVGFMACLPLLGTDGAMLSPMAGTVDVNGQPIVAGSAIVTGDTVAVSPDGSARMVLPGGSLIAASKTHFAFERNANVNQVRLSYGMVKVAGNLAVALHKATVVPTSPNARFAVTALDGPVYVQAIAGSVKIEGLSKTYTVNAGEAVRFQDQAAPAAAAGSSGTSVPLPVTIGIAAASAVVTGIIVHQVTKCDNCVPSPAQ